jgi:FKBP-type peptidyl-prolyl cis-trans isomerase
MKHVTGSGAVISLYITTRRGGERICAFGVEEREKQKKKIKRREREEREREEKKREKRRKKKEENEEKKEKEEITCGTRSSAGKLLDFAIKYKFYLYK